MGEGERHQNPDHLVEGEKADQAVVKAQVEDQDQARVKVVEGEHSNQPAVRKRKRGKSCKLKVF